jgi:SAM-dependent methyltransferase
MMTGNACQTDASQARDDMAEPDGVDDLLAMVTRLLTQAGAYSVLHPGCGCGRYGRHLARAGFLVTAFDLTTVAVRAAASRNAVPDATIRYLVGDPSLPSRDIGQYDGLFAPNILHLFLTPDRHRLLRMLGRHLRLGGLAVITALSVNDARYGQGREVEHNTFEILPGQYIHFYSEEELHVELARHLRLSVIEPAIEIEVDHLGNRREYSVLLACGVKSHDH